MRINSITILYATIILVLLIALSNVLFIENHDVAVEIWKYDMFLTVGDYTGFNVDTSAIFFGTVKPGGTSARNIQLENNHNLTLKVTILTEGDLAEWVYSEQNSFYLYSGEKKTINVKAFVPKSAKFGDYGGEIRVKFELV